MEINKEKPKAKFSFKKYLESNESYKIKHYAFMCTKIDCSCGRQVVRSNMSKHKRTKIHIELHNAKNPKPEIEKPEIENT